MAAIDDIVVVDSGGMERTGGGKDLEGGKWCGFVGVGR